MSKDPVEIFKESIFSYEDYRSFLKDYFVLRKRLRSTYTQRYFAQKHGFSTHAFFSYVINGKRNISLKTLSKFVEALELESTKADYFETLVNFNQTTEVVKKDVYYEELQKIRKRVKFSTLSTKQSDFFAKWYYPVLRELAVRADWEENYAVLAALVNPSITEKEAKDGIELMLDIGVLIKRNGEYHLENENLDDSGIPVFIKKKSRRDIFQTGLESLERLGPSERHCSYATFAANREVYAKINEYYDEFLDKVTGEVTGIESEEVFQLTYQLFPVSRNFKKGNKE